MINIAKGAQKTRWLMITENNELPMNRILFRKNSRANARIRGGTVRGATINPRKMFSPLNLCERSAYAPIKPNIMERRPTLEATIRLFFSEPINLESFTNSIYQSNVKPGKGKVGYLPSFME
jgi:hypothetical protein